MTFDTTYNSPSKDELVEVDLSIEEYKKYIFNLTNRILKGNYISMNVIKGVNNQPIIKFSFREPEWYMDLDDDTKYNVRLNLSNHLESMGSKILEKNGVKVKSIENY